jgi:hypothetical protein
MNFKSILLAAVAVVSLSPAQAQGVQRGAERGAREGSRDAGPVGAVVGGAVGGIVGGVNGLLGIDDRPRFHKYVIEQRHRSYDYDGRIVVGAMLPERGIEYYDVPDEYNVKRYRYTIINGTPVLVDPDTKVIVEVID